MSARTEKHIKKAHARLESLKTIFAVFWRDIKRLLKNPVALAIFLGLIIFPCIYSWYNIAVNLDPYANVKNVTIDVVNNDKAVSNELTGEVCVGNSVEKAVESNDKLHFQIVDEEQGMEDVKAGKAFATLVIPDDFTARILGIITPGNTTGAPTMQFYVNEKNNALGTVVSNTALSTLEGQVNSTFSAAVGKVVGELMNSVSADFAGQAVQMQGSIIEKLNLVNQKIDNFNNSLSLADTTIANSRDTIAECSNLIVQVQKEIDIINEQISATKTDLTAVKAQVDKMIEDDPHGLFVDLLRDISSQISTALAELGQIDGALMTLSSRVGSANSLLTNLDTSLANLATANASTEEALTLTKETIKLVASKLTTSSLSNGTEFLASLLSMDSNELASFMKTPVQFNTEKFYPVKNYGTGVTPFYTNLALWVAGFMLLALVRIEVDRKGFKCLTSKQAYLARGLLYTVAGFMTGILCCAGNLLIGIQCENPVAYVFFGGFVGMVYLNIIYMLAATFKHIGKALAVVLIIMQIPGSSGTYPIEMMPDVFQFLYPFFPFSYGINAMRELIAGMYGTYFFWQALALLGFWLLALFIGLFIRPLCLNLNWIFDRELSKSDIVICDDKDHSVIKNTFLVNSFLNLIKDPDMRAESLDRLQKYEANVPRYRKKAILVMALSPVVLLAIMAVLSSLIEIDSNVKLIMLILWIVLLVVVAAVIIYIEYTHQRCKHQLNAIKAQEHTLNEKIVSQVSSVKTMLGIHEHTYAEEASGGGFQKKNKGETDPEKGSE